MIDIVLQFLPLGAAAIAPVMVVAVILLLSADKGFKKALAFIAGRLLCYGLWAVIFLFVFQSIAQSAGEPAQITLWIKIALGVLLVVLAVKNIVRRKKSPGQPKWMAKLDKARPIALFGIGFGLSVVQVRYVVLMLAGATIITAAGLPPGQIVITASALVLLIIWIQLLPLIIYLIMGKKAASVLASLKEWTIRHQNIINFIVLLLFGLILIGKGLGGLL